MPETIKFYGRNLPHPNFSNFARWPITLEEKAWPTSEHYFQAKKFEGTDHEERVRLAKNPSEAARIGRDRSLPLRQDWEEAKDDIMRKAVLAKFTQHDELLEELIGTGDAVLIEHTANDAYWGDGGDGSGKNMLGKILMEVRTALVENRL